jgi:hypothetical protein
VSNLSMRTAAGEVLRRALSWVVIAEATLLGILALAMFAGAPYRPPAVTVATLVLGIAAIVSSFIATRNPRRAASIALWVTPIAGVPVFLGSRGFIAGFTVVAGALLFPGLFWLATSRRGWPLPISSSILPRNPYLRSVLCVGLVFALVAVAFLSSLLLPWWAPIGDCAGQPLLSDHGSPRNIDFTAKILFVAPRTYNSWSLCAVARVEHRFSNLASGPAGLIILRGFFHPDDKSERYFVESNRSRNALVRFLPVFEPTRCGHTAHWDDAGVALRVLHDGPPTSGGRLIGRVYAGSGMLAALHNPRSGVSVLVKGAAMSSISVTDADGIYDFVSLPPGRYTVEPLTATSGRNLAVGFDLRLGEVEDRSLFLE